MNESFELKAEVRSDLGKGASRRLRRQNLVPGVIYGAGVEPQGITLGHNDLVHHLENEAFYSHILSITCNGKTDKAILRDVQRHPSRPRILHIDLMRVDEKTKIKISIPLHFKHEDICHGVKVGAGVISHLMSQVEIQCLAKDLPAFIEVDMEKVELGHSLHLSQIALPTGIELVDLAHDRDLAVANVLKPRAAEEETVVKPAEGTEAAATPAAGAAATPAAGTPDKKS